MITYTDVETFLNIDLATGGQSLVNALIADVEAYAASYCNRNFEPGDSEITEYFDGGTDIFFVATPPVKSITSVKVDGVLYNATYVYNYRHYIQLDAPASRGNLSVEIKYKSDMTASADLKQALVRWVAEIFQSQKDAGKPVKRKSVGQVSLDFDTHQGIPDYVQKVLDKYRLMPGV